MMESMVSVKTGLTIVWLDISTAREVVELALRAERISAVAEVHRVPVECGVSLELSSQTPDPSQLSSQFAVRARLERVSR